MDKVGATSLVCKLRWTPKGVWRGLVDTSAAIIKMAPNYELKSHTFYMIFKKSCKNGNFENHTPTPQFDIKFWKKGPLSSVCLKHLTFGMIFKKSCENCNFEHHTPTPQLDIKFCKKKSFVAHVFETPYFWYDFLKITWKIVILKNIPPLPNLTSNFETECWWQLLII